MPRTCSISTLGYSQAGIFLWSQCQKCLCLSRNLPLSTGQCDPTTGTIAPQKGERTPGTPKASVRDSAESLSPLHWIYPHPCKKPARCFNYKHSPKSHLSYPDRWCSICQLCTAHDPAPRTTTTPLSIYPFMKCCIQGVDE